MSALQNYVCNAERVLQIFMSGELSGTAMIRIELVITSPFKFQLLQITILYCLLRDQK